jgi:predicted nucleotidyltransferase
LKKSGIPVSKLILFGSQARGTARKDSDIDVCVVSPVLGKDRLKERVLLAHQATPIDPLIEPVPVSTKDFKSNRVSPLLHQIRKEAIEI